MSEVADIIDRAGRYVDEGWLPAAQLAVARDGKLLAFESFGEATDATRFCIFSATKPLVAASLLVLVAEGALEVEQPVSRYISEFGRDETRKITVEQFMLHTAGFPNAPMRVEEGADRESRLRRFATWEPECEPGTRFEYHAASAHWVIAELIESTSGVDFRAFIQNRVCAPLGLPRLLGTAVGSQPKVAPLKWVGKAQGESGPGDLSFAFDDPYVIECGSPGGGGIATAGEVAMFYQGLLRNDAKVWDADLLADATGNIRCRFAEPMFDVPVNRTLCLVVAGDDGLHTMRYGAFAEGNSPGSFGHAGAHVQVAWADPVSGISFCYLTSGLDSDTMREGIRGLKLSNLAAALEA